MKTIVITLLFCLASIYAEEAAKPLPREAQQVVEKLNDDIVKVRKDAVAKLNKVLVEVTKSGDLELALSLKKEIDNISKDIPGSAATSGPPSTLTGKWKCKSDLGWSCIVQIDDKLNTTWSDGRTGRIAINRNANTWCCTRDDRYKQDGMKWDNDKQAFIGKHVRSNGSIESTIEFKKMPE